ncbi:hypothetical protein HYW75_02750 [Candidatus Pacearchaeota archaeon]|nr:hypothetical protein [Candidatus Pacearchaeota archaeon]
MDTRIKPHGRVMEETYRVREIEQVKCWTVFILEECPNIYLKRLYTSQDLANKGKGKEIKVTRIEYPQIPNSKILEVSYQGKRIYPYNN